MTVFRLYDAAELGPKGYPLPWERAVDDEPRIPDLVRELAGHRCLRCGHPFRTGESDPEWSACDERCHHGGEMRWRDGKEGDLVDRLADAVVVAQLERDGLITDVAARWRVLTVHHLTGQKADCRWWNLVALCQRCHLQIQNRVKMSQIYPWEHSDWFKPYAAGYYAWVYLGEELDRQAVDERLDELLALEAAP